MVFFIAHQDMGHKWAFTWKKRNGNLDSLPMPVLTIICISYDIVTSLFKYRCVRQAFPRVGGGT